MDRELLISEEMKKREEIMTNFQQNYLLEAGAGAGKTTIIVQRIINHIINSDIEPSSIVAITFTKAASTELAERIQLKALEYLKKEKDKKIIAKLESIDEIFTGTIHSFCDLILREMPFEAGLTPGYEIIEDAEEFLENIWYDFIRSREEDYKEKIDLLWKFNIDYRELRTKAIEAMENPDIKFVGYDHIDGGFQELEEEFSRIQDSYKDLDGSVFMKRSNLGKFLIALLEEGMDLGACIDVLLRETSKYGLEVDEAYEKLVLKKHLNGEQSEDYKDFLEDIFNIYHRLNGLAYNTATDFINMAVDYKEENYGGQLTFNELLYRASKLIRESPVAKEHFKNKYKYYYVDEFQDTDPMQAELILHLTDVGEYIEGKYWQECLPRPGSLFVVGDPKQSIYRFRRADISIYNQVKEIVDKNGEVVYLDINFRSSDNICEWVESAFKKKEDDFGFEEEATQVQAGFKKILSLWDDSPEDSNLVPGKSQLKGIYKYEPQGQAEDHSPSEEEYVAQMVEDIIKNYYIVEKKRRDKSKLKEGEKEFYNISRDIEPKDIMILTKSNAETGVYLRALKNRNIPALLAGEKNLGDVRELSNLFLLIDALLDYRDNIKTIAALRNSFYLDLDTMDLFLEDNINLSAIIFKKEEIEKISHPHIRDALSYMWKLNSLIRSLSPIAFIETLVRDKIGIYNMDRNYSDLEKRDVESALTQSLELLKAKGCASIYEIRNELEKLVKHEVNYELPLNNEFANNAARVMNIHKSKGLEADIVFLVGRDKKSTLGGNSHYVEKDEDNNNLGYMVYKSSLNILGPGEEDKKDREKSFKIAENHRLLYVAATRAKSTLILGAADEENLFLSPLSRKVEAELVTDFNQRIRAERSLGNRKKEEVKYTNDLRIRKKVLDYSYYKMNPSQFSYEKDDFNNSYQEFKSPRFKSLKKEKSQRNKFAPRGKVYGTILHRAMELLINKSKGLEDLDQDTIDYATNLAIGESIEQLEIKKENIGLFYPLKSKRLEELLEARFTEGATRARDMIKERLSFYLKRDLLKFINNKDIRDIFKNAKNIFTELQFSMPLDKNNKELLSKLSKFIGEEKVKNLHGKTAIVNGVIDLVIESKDNTWTILDYKTDVIQKGDVGQKLSFRYGGQLEGYKIFLEEILRSKGMEVENLILYSTFRDELIYVLSAARA